MTPPNPPASPLDPWRDGFPPQAAAPRPRWPRIVACGCLFVLLAPPTCSVLVIVTLTGLGNTLDAVFSQVSAAVDSAASAEPPPAEPPPEEH